MNEERIFHCPCGAYLIGTELAYDQHLHFSCEVYAEAVEILQNA